MQSQVIPLNLNRRGGAVCSLSQIVLQWASVKETPPLVRFHNVKNSKLASFCKSGISSYSSDWTASTTDDRSQVGPGG